MRYKIAALMTLIFTLTPIPIGVQVEAQDPMTVSIRVTSQRFESGEMIYRHDTGTIYVLENIETENSGDSWKFAPSQYGSLPGVNLPTANEYYSAPSGFSKIWANMPEIQESLGQPVLPEIGFETRVTRIVNRVFMERFDGLVYQIYDNGYWRYTDSFPVSARPTKPNESDGQIVRFEVSPQNAISGNSLTLMWNIVGTDVDYANFLILDSVTYQRIQPEVNSLMAATSGETTINIPSNSVGDIIIRLEAVEGNFSTGYTLFDQEEIIVPTSIDANITVDNSVYQPFENGFMLWLDAYNHVLEFHEDGRYIFRYIQPYMEASETDHITTPDGIPAVAEPFKRAWHVQQETLGYPTREAQTYPLILEQTDDADVLYTLPDSRVVRANVDVANNGTWQYR